MKPEVTKAMTRPCGNCKFCPSIRQTNTITNVKSNITSKIVSGGCCKTKNVIYAAKCKRHETIYVGHTGETLATRFAKHRYDIGKRPSNSELAEHFHKDHNVDQDLEVAILQSGVNDTSERVQLEDRWMRKLQTLSPTGLNQDCKAYAKEMYTCWKALTSV